MMMARTQEGRGGSRGLGTRGQSTALRSSFRDSGAIRLTLAEAAKVHRAADRVREKAQSHYEKHRDTWVARHYGKLLLKAMPTLALTPPGMWSDPKIALMNRARNEVQRNHAKRLQFIETVRKAMLDAGRMRESRKIEWGGKAAVFATVADRGSHARASSLPDGKAAKDARPVTRTEKARIAVAQDRARRRAEAHLAKNQEKWTAKRYYALTDKFHLSKGKLSEKDAQHVRDVAMEVANRGVTAKHEARLQRIDAACVRLLDARKPGVQPAALLGGSFDDEVRAKEKIGTRAMIVADTVHQSANGKAALGLPMIVFGNVAGRSASIYARLTDGSPAFLVFMSDTDYTAEALRRLGD
ncbi:hypothetical protein WG908_16215 [Sphingobium sp. AN641]|uniref:hypothetical protein n=1 Tax=Sphingobium sp. AN641 TaxID=3133443 RepID=UPI0030C20FB9